MNKVLQARIFLIIASLFWAIESSIFVFSSEKFGAANFMILRNLFIVIYCALCLAATKKIASLRLKRSKITPVVFVAIASGILADFGLYYSLQFVPIVNGLVIGHLQPFFMILFGYLVFREKPLSKLQIAGGTVMFIASMLVSAGTFEELAAFRFGAWQNLIILGSAILWAASALAVKHYMTELSPFVVIFYRYLLSLIVVGIIFIINQPLVAPDYLVALNALAVLSGLTFWFLGLRTLSAPEVGFIELFSPLFGLAIAAVYLGQPATLLHLIGCTLLFVGFAGLIKEEK